MPLRPAALPKLEGKLLPGMANAWLWGGKCALLLSCACLQALQSSQTMRRSLPNLSRLNPPASGAAGDGIAAALKAWGNLACEQWGVPPKDRSGLTHGSLLTLVNCVAGLAGRVQSLLPPGKFEVAADLRCCCVWLCWASNRGGLLSLTTETLTAAPP